MRLFDSIRNKNLAPRKEECIRQKLLKEMTGKLGYPKTLLAVEADLSVLPHLKNRSFAARRVDILCYANDIHSEFDLYPLLLIECKAFGITKSAFQQVVGYNYYVKAPFIALAAENALKVFWRDCKTSVYRSINFLPYYEELLRQAKELFDE